jgi:bacterioferritin
MHEKSIKLLNSAIAGELIAVHQYMYFHFHCDDQGYDLLSNIYKRTAMEEMRHVEFLADRILFLNGKIVLKAGADVEPIHEVKEMLEWARASEQDAIRDYNQDANASAANSDSATKRIFEDLVADEERHFNQFDMEYEKLLKFGERYLVLQALDNSAATPGAVQ